LVRIASAQCDGYITSRNYYAITSPASASYTKHTHISRSTPGLCNPEYTGMCTLSLPALAQVALPPHTLHQLLPLLLLLPPPLLLLHPPLLLLPPPLALKVSQGVLH